MNNWGIAVLPSFFAQCAPVMDPELVTYTSIERASPDAFAFVQACFRPTQTHANNSWRVYPNTRSQQIRRAARHPPAFALCKLALVFIQLLWPSEADHTFVGVRAAGSGAFADEVTFELGDAGEDGHDNLAGVGSCRAALNSLPMMRLWRSIISSVMVAVASTANATRVAYRRSGSHFIRSAGLIWPSSRAILKSLF